MCGDWCNSRNVEPFCKFFSHPANWQRCHRIFQTKQVISRGPQILKYIFMMSEPRNEPLKVLYSGPFVLFYCEIACREHQKRLSALNWLFPHSPLLNHYEYKFYFPDEKKHVQGWAKVVSLIRNMRSIFHGGLPLLNADTSLLSFVMPLIPTLFLKYVRCLRVEYF